MPETILTETQAKNGDQLAKSLPLPTKNKLPRATSVPIFDDPYKKRDWEKSQMTAAFRVFASLGFADGVAGHMSLRDPVNTHLFWINPLAVHFSQINVSDLVLVNEDGEIQEDTPYTASGAGFIIHSVLHQMRPDINVAVHLHTPYGVAWSAFGRPVEMLFQDMCYFYDNLSVYQDFEGVVLAKEEGVNLAKALGPRNMNIILQNHGNVGEAAGLFIALERACQRQLLVEAAAANGLEKQYISDRVAAYTKLHDYSPEHTYMGFQPEYNRIVAETNGDFLN